MYNITFQFSRSVVYDSLQAMNCSMPGLPVHHQLPEPTQTHLHRVSDAIQPSHSCHPLLLLPSVFPSIRVFSNESVFHISWPKYWSFSISPSNEYSGLISFRIDWFDLLATLNNQNVDTILKLLKNDLYRISRYSPRGKHIGKFQRLIQDQIFRSKQQLLSPQVLACKHCKEGKTTEIK